MYSKAEISQLKQEFWTIFGQYMAPMRSAEGEKVNWVNYRTGIRDIRFSMQAERDEANIGIVVQSTDPLTRELYFDQLIRLKHLFGAAAGEGWDWQPTVSDDFGRPVGRIMQSLTGVSIYRREDWPALISFFKPRMIALDAFWCDVKYGFENI